MSYPAFSFSIHLWRRISSRSAKNSLYKTEFFTSSEASSFGGSIRFVLSSLSPILSRSQIKTAVLSGLHKNAGSFHHGPAQRVLQGKNNDRSDTVWAARGTQR